MVLLHGVSDFLGVNTFLPVMAHAADSNGCPSCYPCEDGVVDSFAYVSVIHWFG